MPVYEYECRKCEHRFEKLGSTDMNPPRCPKCKSETRKVVSQSTFQLKGGGWAKDGYQ
jgi:putative FmdB family regulatory protein